MTDPDRTLIAVLLDRSGSMESIRTDSEGGFNSLIADQRNEPGQARVTLAQFDTEYDVVYSNRPIADVGPLQLKPRGMTALLDAIGRLITDVGAELSAQPEAERPGKVIVVVVTDGLENSSMEWNVDDVRAAITRQQDQYSWEFLFLGANMDAVEVGRHMGFAADRSMTYEPSAETVASTYRAKSKLISRMRNAPAGQRVEGFSDADREAARSTVR